MVDRSASEQRQNARRGETSHSEDELGSLSAQLFAIAAKLQGVARNPDHRAALQHGTGDLAGLQQFSLLACARRAYWLRRQRAAIFGCEDLFGEPAWDILLDLYIAHGEGKQVSVSSACIGSASPPTTGLRWLSVLADKGLVSRENDAADNRRIMVRLSDQGVAAVEQFLNLAGSQR